MVLIVIIIIMLIQIEIIIGLMNIINNSNLLMFNFSLRINNKIREVINIMNIKGIIIIMDTKEITINNKIVTKEVMKTDNIIRITIINIIIIIINKMNKYKVIIIINIIEMKKNIKIMIKIETCHQIIEIMSIIILILKEIRILINNNKHKDLIITKIIINKIIVMLININNNLRYISKIANNNNNQIVILNSFKILFYNNSNNNYKHKQGINNNKIRILKIMINKGRIFNNKFNCALHS